MKQNHTNPALAHMDVAQEEIASYAMLVNKAQLSLTESMQAFERANENSLTGDCPIKKQITQELREQYATLSNLTAAIVETISAPTLSRMIATAPKQTSQLVALLDCLPEPERNLITVALISLLQAEGEDLSLAQEEVNLAASILYAIGKWVEQLLHTWLQAWEKLSSVQGEVTIELAIATLLKAESKRTMRLTLKTWYPYQDQMIITLPQLTIVATFRPIQFWKYHYWAYMHNRQHYVFQSPYCTLAMRKLVEARPQVLDSSEN